MKTKSALKTINLCILAGTIFLSSCSELRSQHYVGEPVDLHDEDLPDESIWMQGEDVYHIRQRGSNMLVAATLDWDHKTGNYAVESFPFMITELDDHIFLNVKKDDDYTILRLACSCDESFILFTVNPEMMKKAIADGSVKAHTDDGHIIMDGTKEELDEFILNNINTMFAMDCGSIAHKLSKDEEDKEKKKKQQPAPAASDEPKTEV